TPKEILAAEANKFQPPPPMVTPVEKRNRNKLCDFHNDKGHNTDKCMQLKKQIEELVRAGKLSHLIKEIKQGREQPKTGRKEAAAKDKPTIIYMVRSWQRTVKQKVTQSFEPGKEIAFPPLTTSSGTEGPLVIEAEIGRHVIHRMYIDGGSSMEILYEHCFNRLRLEIKSQMVPATTSLIGFSGETTWPLGQLRLLVTIGDTTDSTKVWMNFMVVKSLSPYNGIIRRPGLKAIQAVPSTVHGMLKFPTERGIVTICSSLLIPAKCASIVVVGGSLSDRGRTELCALLKKNLDIFAWQPSDMTGVPRSVVEHRLNIREGCPSVRQKKKGQAPERAKAIQAEVQKLVEARIMREVYYHDWLSNPVMVKMHDGSWRLCVDFMDLNKACPQDCYPLPEIDWKVESLYGYPFKCFLDAYKGYHQIQLAEADEEKTAFHTGHGVYCYTKMPFGLKNAGATYQRVMDKVFERQMGPQEELIMYLSATHGAISAVLMTEWGTAQTTIYFISRALQGSELNYSPMEKLVLSLVFTAKRLRRYFQAHPIMVITDQPIKQAMSQFLNEMPGNASQGVPVAITQEEPWTLFTDGSSCIDGSGSGLILTNPKGVEFTYALRFQFAASNNEAEYEALVAGLRIATQMGVKNVQVNVDSKLVANQVLGTYVAKKDNMIKYLEIVKGLVSGFIIFSISQVPRSKNKKADALSKLASTSFPHLSKQVPVEVLETKSITGKEVTTVIEEEGPTWMTELVDYLKKGILPGDEKKARKLRLKARQYELMEGVLYKRSFLTPWLRCVRPLQAEYVMREIHEGSCSMHAGPRSVVAKAVRLRYYWPTMHTDTRDMIRKCSDCQIHRPITRHPQQPLTPFTAPWPFYKWGIDIAGPFSEGPGKVKFLIVAMDYFTKWIEAKAVATITGGQANRSLWEGIKAHLGEGNKNWVEELPHVLWAHRTMIKSSHGNTPLSLTYEIEAVIPAEIGMPTYSTAAVDVVNNDEKLRLNLDLREERQELATVSEAKSKSKMMKYYNARVRGMAFKPGDFVYRSNDASHAIAGGKLGPKWEGPYEVTEALGNGAYKLRSTEGTVLPRTWNVTNLKRCYL
nr:reverse transcriptase domain-containing protein [Tanacetum cinerariifolium]